MTDQLISHDTARLAKEKGFYIPRYYHGNDLFLKDDYPTQSFLAKWLRDKHGIHILIIPTVTTAWTFKTITVLSERDNDVIIGLKSVSDLPPYKEVNGYDYSTYEQALEAGLLESLKQLTN